MKQSVKKFIEYISSEEELAYYIRTNAEWNEESFEKMKQLVGEVIKDYEDEDYYPKKIIVYFMVEIPSIINMLSHFKVCTEKEILQGHTQETYLDIIAERKKRLDDLRWEFIKSL